MYVPPNIRVLPNTCLPTWEVAELHEPKPLGLRNLTGFIGPDIAMRGIQIGGVRVSANSVGRVLHDTGVEINLLRYKPPRRVSRMLVSPRMESRMEGTSQQHCSGFVRADATRERSSKWRAGRMRIESSLRRALLSRVRLTRFWNGIRQLSEIEDRTAETSAGPAESASKAAKTKEVMV